MVHYLFLSLFVYSFRWRFNNGHCDKAAILKSGYRIRLRIHNEQVKVKRKLPGMTWGRNPVRLKMESIVFWVIMDCAIMSHYSTNIDYKMKQYWVYWRDLQFEGRYWFQFSSLRTQKWPFSERFWWVKCYECIPPKNIKFNFTCITLLILGLAWQKLRTGFQTGKSSQDKNISQNITMGERERGFQHVSLNTKDQNTYTTVNHSEYI